MEQTFEELEDYRDIIAQRIDPEFRYNTTENWKHNTMELFGFVRSHAGYPTVESIKDKYYTKINDFDIAVKYGVPVSQIGELINNSFEILSRYKNILYYGYDKCKEENLLTPELTNVGISQEIIDKLIKMSIYSPKQILESDNLKYNLSEEDYNEIYERLDSIDIGMEANNVETISEKDIVTAIVDPITYRSLNIHKLNDIENNIFRALGMQEKVSTERKRPSSAAKAIMARSGYNIVYYDKIIGYVIEDIEKENNMKKKKNDISQVVANKRTSYPYGVLYGTFSLNEQNNFPKDFLKNTNDLMDKLAESSQAVSMYIDNLRDGLTFDQIQEKYGVAVNYSSIVEETYKLVKQNKDAVLRGLSKSKIGQMKLNTETPDETDASNSESEFKAYGIYPMSIKFLNRMGIFKISDLDSISSKKEFIDKCKSINLSVIGINNLFQDVIGKMNKHGFDTTRFGYPGIEASNDKEQMTSEEFHKIVDRPRNVVESDKANALEYAKSFFGKTISNDEFELFVKKFSTLWRGTSDKILNVESIKNYLRANLNITFSTNEDKTVSFVKKGETEKKFRRKTKKEDTVKTECKRDEEKKEEVIVNSNTILSSEVAPSSVANGIFDDNSLLNLIKNRPSTIAPVKISRFKKVVVDINIQCPHCSSIIPINDISIDKDNRKNQQTLYCSNCLAKLIYSNSSIVNNISDLMS